MAKSRLRSRSDSTSSGAPELRDVYKICSDRFIHVMSSLAVLEIADDSQLSPSLTDNIKHLPHFPASTCKRHVYIFDFADIEKSPYMLSLFKSGEFNALWQEEAYQYLLIWYMGGKNQDKFLQDTYNVKTVDLIYKVFSDIIAHIHDADLKSFIEDNLRRLKGSEDELKAKLLTLELQEKDCSGEEAMASLKKQIESVSSNIGWTKEEAKLYSGLPSRIGKSIEGNYENFLHNFEFIMQCLREDSKYLATSKQKDLDDKKSLGEAGRSCWSYGASYLRSVHKKDPELVGSVLGERIKFLQERSREAIIARKETGRCASSQPSSRPSSPKKGAATELVGIQRSVSHE